MFFFFGLQHATPSLLLLQELQRRRDDLAQSRVPTLRRAQGPPQWFETNVEGLETQLWGNVRKTFNYVDPLKAPEA